MAQPTTDDDLDRRATAGIGGRGRGSRGPALADEGRDELPALLAFAISIVVLVIVLLWPSTLDVALGGAARSAGQVAVDEGSPADGGDDGPETGAGPSDEASTVDEDGAVNDVDRSDQPSVVDEDDPAVVATEQPAVEVTSTQVSIVLEGTVPDAGTRDALISLAVTVYPETQVEDRLRIDAGAVVPVRVSVGGSMTDPVLHAQVSSAFDGVAGVEVDVARFDLEESSDLEAALNDLEPIQFASGSAIVQPESGRILDEAAELLLASPDVVVEIGGHTDSRGGEEANRALSEARAGAVLAELQSRGVESELSAIGFGESRLKEPNDVDDAAAQQSNRRIEFRIIG